MKINRFSWTPGLMNIGPADHILEIGCGTGLAAEQIVPMLKKGKLIAIDQSRTAIDKAVKKNENAIKQGKAEFIQTAFLAMPKPQKKFDKIFAFNINFFWTQESIMEEANLLKKIINKEGRLFVLYGPMLEGGWEKIKPKVIANLEAAGFLINDTIRDKIVNCCCFIFSLK